MRVLLVEDDAQLSGRLCTLLTGAGYAVDLAEDGEAGWYLSTTQSYDAVVLDLGLPGIPGLELLRRWRGQGQKFPILILTARTGWVERVGGLNAGADDYLEKPFQGAEVVARLRALLRRAADQPTASLRHGAIEVTPATGSATCDGVAVELTARELRILSYFLHRPGRIVSQDELADHIYSVDEPRTSNTIEVYIARLRKKFGRDAIRTVRGLGYRLE